MFSLFGKSIAYFVSRDRPRLPYLTASFRRRLKTAKIHLLPPACHLLAYLLGHLLIAC